MNKTDLKTLKELLRELREDLEVEKCAYEKTRGKDHYITLCLKEDIWRIDDAIEIINRR